MSYLYQRRSPYFAQIAGGSEALGVQELIRLGASRAEPAYRGVHFSADRTALYRIVYHSRLLTRVLAPLVQFDCPDEYALYDFAYHRMDWMDFMRVEDTFAIFATVANSRINHSQYASLKLKDALVDQFRDRTGDRPSVERETPDVWFNLHIERNRATISLDVSGGSLHRRGYRVEAGKAPMQETVAAAVLELSGWAGETSLYDPMCGSGTLLAEALIRASNLPAGYFRKKWGVPFLPDFDAYLWDKVRQQGDEQVVVPLQGLVAGSDRDERVIHMAQQNLRPLPGGNSTPLYVSDFRDLGYLEDMTIVCNPPYGVRMGDLQTLGHVYRMFGDFLKQRCKGSTAYIYCGTRELISDLGLKPAFKKPLVNGPLDGRLVKLELF